MQDLGVFDRKILREINEAFCDFDVWRIRCNHKLMGFTASQPMSSELKYSGLVDFVMSSVWMSLLQLVRFLIQNRAVAVAEGVDQTCDGATRYPLGNRSWRQTARNRQQWRQELAVA